jgi:hypothetical protein
MQNLVHPLPYPDKRGAGREVSGSAYFSDKARIISMMNIAIAFLLFFTYLATTKLTSLFGTTITLFTSLPSIYFCAISDSVAYFSKAALSAPAGT